MRRRVPCPVCLQHSGVEAIANASTYDFGSSNVLEAICSKGHAFLVLNQNPKFEVLFEYACSAFLDGYVREAVSSAATALERAMEFFIRATLNSTQDPKAAESVWAGMSKNSQRQLGAFIALHQVFVGTQAPRLDTVVRGQWRDLSAEAFRNSVVHVGEIPSEEDARKYLDFVYTYIAHILRALRTNGVGQAFLSKQVTDMSKRIPEGKPAINIAMGGELKNLIYEGEPASLEVYLDMIAATLQGRNPRMETVNPE